MKIAYRLWPVAAIALAACGDPQTHCREGVEQMKAQLAGVVGSKEHISASSRVVQASTQLDIAQTELATGNYESCLQSLEQARTLLKPGT
jgi:hypothetical protein